MAENHSLSTFTKEGGSDILARLLSYEIAQCKSMYFLSDSKYLQEFIEAKYDFFSGFSFFEETYDNLIHFYNESTPDCHSDEVEHLAWIEIISTYFTAQLCIELGLEIKYYPSNKELLVYPK